MQYGAEFRAACEKLYGKDCDESYQRARWEKLEAQFDAAFGSQAEEGQFFSSSGRIEIIGNHTDHNHGKVLVGAISADILACAAATSDGFVTIKSEGFADIMIDIADTAAKKSEEGTSLALVKGVLEGFKRRNLPLGGFCAVMTSDVFKGAGVSSSAAYEVLIAEILNVFYNGGALDAVTKAQIAQFAENVYFGKPCGLLDQTGVALGGIAYVDFADPSAPKVEKLSYPFDGYKIVITNTGGDHSDLTDSYAAIRSEMESVSRCFGRETLRDVGYEAFFAEIPRLAKKLSGRAILRALHFFDENERVEQGRKAIKAKSAKKFLGAVSASGDSSFRLLQNLFVSGDKQQILPLAVEYSKRLTSGAVRVHGGGFAGTILAFVPLAEVDAYAAGMAAVYGAENVFTASVREPGACRVF